MSGSYCGPPAGGIGDPLERDPEAVAEDVVERRVSVEAAREGYGVVVSQSGTLDAAATTILRASRRAAR
jgi:N-methylhydantoinase B